MILKTDIKDSSIPVQLAKSLRLDKNKERGEDTLP